MHKTLAALGLASLFVVASGMACSSGNGADFTPRWNKGGAAGADGSAGGDGGPGGSVNGGSAGTPQGGGSGQGGGAGDGGSTGQGGDGQGGSGGDASVQDAISDTPPEVCFKFTCSSDERSVLDCWDNVIQTCGPTQVCRGGFCKEACNLVENDKTSVGCNYIAVDMHEHHGGSCFVAMVANTWAFNAHMNVRRWNGSQMVDLPVEQFTRIPTGSGASINYGAYSAANGIEPGKVALVFLSGAAAGGVACPTGITPAVPGSAVLVGTGLAEGFEIQTDVPIVAYQMNPYGGGHAAVTGASLLLPNAAWGQGYVAMNAYTSGVGTASLNVVAWEDGTEVTFTPKAAVTGGGGIPSSGAGVPFKVNLRRAQHMQITQTQELTGSIVTANKRIGFFAGNTCAQVPVGASYCDHQEQMLPPVRAFGSEYASVQYKPRGTNDPTRWRIVAAADGTVVTFDPAVTSQLSLNKGGWQEFTSMQPFVARSQDAQHPILVTAYMTGSSQVGGPFAGDSGDPDMCVIVPAEQYMKKYVFLSDSTYPTTNLVFVRKRSANNTYADVTLDCAGVLSGWQNVDSQGLYQYTRQDLVNGSFQPVGACDNGVHVAESTEPFGLWVWGWGYQGTSTFTANVSYSFPAGANMTTLNTVMP